MRVSIVFSLILLTVYLPSGLTYSCTGGSSNTNYCNYYNCYIYSNVNVGETLNYCLTNYYYRYYNHYYTDSYVYIHYSGNINIELNLPSRVISLRFYSYTDSVVTINSTKVHSHLTYLNFNYKAYHFNQAYFFSYFPSLVSLSASAYLDFTYPQTFTRLSQLTRLYVSPSSGSLNWKFEIVNDAFRGLSQLKYIELVKGDLLDVRNAFIGLTSLSHLGLEGNKIQKLEPNMFKDLHSLTYLDLDGNGIKEVSDEAFVGLTALKSLSISGNPLFPLNTLSRLTAVTSLQINYNSYRTLPPDPFEQMQSLRYLYADNPFFCDCSLRWTSVVSQYSLSIQSAYCLEPSKVYRTSITSTSLYTNCTVDRSYGCFSKSVSCPIEFVCRDTGTSHACTCADGYNLLYTGVCVDENECELGQASCAQHCNNTIGSFECYCDPGYQLTADDFSCEDIDECQMGTSQCSQSETCTNTVGSYACIESECVRSCDDPVNHSCTCCIGYQLNNNYQCVDIDECQELTIECDTNCHNTKGSYECSCTQGYQLVNQTKCIDIDECLTSNGGCDNMCVNTVGSYHCLNINISSIISYECNELGNSKACPDSTIYSCVCCNGYHEVNSECFDVNECEGSDHICDMNCHNTNGSYQCSCNEGYQLVNQTNCLDIDECLTHNGGCEGMCVNTVGSYHCLNINISSIISYECNELGNSKACPDSTIYSCVCCNGYHKVNSECLDVNECEGSDHICDMNCHNTNGSYQCSCNEGYQLVNQTNCLDIDECLTHNSDCEGICVNTVGSYHCLNISTSSIASYECTELGYTKTCLNPSSNNCDCCHGFSKQNSQCIDVNECQQSTHKCAMICQNTKGSYQCSCPQGFQLVNDTKCLDIDECLMDNGGCPLSCMNTNGSFVCLDVTITGNHVQQTDSQSNGQSSSPNPSIIAVMVLLVIIIIIVILVFTVIIVIMRGVIKRNKYQTVFQPIPNQRDNVYELPSRDTDDGARLLEKVNTSDDGISENSVEIYPAPIVDNPSK